MSDKKTYKSFKEFAKDYLKEYDDNSNFVGVGGFSIGSLDSFKPEVDLGDSAPSNRGSGDSRGTKPETPSTRSSKNLQHSLNKKDHKKIGTGTTMTGEPVTKIEVEPHDPAGDNLGEKVNLLDKLKK
jgi:hypothetical protein